MCDSLPEITGYSTRVLPAGATDFSFDHSPKETNAPGNWGLEPNQLHFRSRATRMALRSRKVFSTFQNRELNRYAYLLGGALPRAIRASTSKNRPHRRLLHLLGSFSLSLGPRRAEPPDEEKKSFLVSSSEAQPLRDELERLVRLGNSIRALGRASGINIETISDFLRGRIRLERRSFEKLEAALPKLAANADHQRFISEALSALLREELERMVRLGHPLESISEASGATVPTISDFLSKRRRLTRDTWLKLEAALEPLEEEIREQAELRQRVRYAIDLGYSRQWVSGVLKVDRLSVQSLIDESGPILRTTFNTIRANIERLESEITEREEGKKADAQEQAKLRHRLACAQALGYSHVAAGKVLGVEWKSVEKLLSGRLCSPKIAARIGDRLPRLDREILEYQEALNSVVWSLPRDSRKAEGDKALREIHISEAAESLSLNPDLLIRALAGEPVHRPNQRRIVEAVKASAIDWTRSHILHLGQNRVAVMLESGFSTADIARTLGVAPRGAQYRFRAMALSTTPERQIEGRTRRIAMLSDPPPIRSWDDLTQIFGLVDIPQSSVKHVTRNSAWVARATDGLVADDKSADPHTRAQHEVEEVVERLLDGQYPAGRPFRYHFRQGLTRFEIIGINVAQDAVTDERLERLAPSVTPDAPAPFLVVREIDRMNERPLAYFVLFPQRRGLSLQLGHSTTYQPTETFERLRERTQQLPDLDVRFQKFQPQTARTAVARISPVFFRSALRSQPKAGFLAYEKALGGVRAIDPDVTPHSVSNALRNEGGIEHYFVTLRKLDQHFGAGHIARRFAELSGREESIFHAFLALLTELRANTTLDILNDGNLEQLLFGYGHQVRNINSIYKIYMRVLRTRGEDLFLRYREIREQCGHEIEAYQVWSAWLDSLAIDLPLLNSAGNRSNCLVYAGLTERGLDARVRIYEHWTATGVDLLDEVHSRQSMSDRDMIGDIAELLRQRAIGLPVGQFNQSYGYYVSAILGSLGLLGNENRGALIERTHGRWLDEDSRLLAVAIDDLLKQGVLDSRLHGIAWRLLRGEEPSEIAEQLSLTPQEYQDSVSELGETMLSVGLLIERKSD